VVVEEVAVLVVLVRRHRRAVRAAARRAVYDEAPGAIEKETGPAAVFLGLGKMLKVPENPWVKMLNDGNA